jgi:hypothetical protein
MRAPSPGSSTLPAISGPKRPPVAGVDDGLDAGERVVEPLAGGQVDAERAADAHDVVPAPLEGGDGE